MTRERIAGFMMGISLGTVVGFYLRPLAGDRRTIRREGLAGNNVQAPVRDRLGVWQPRSQAHIHRAPAD